MAKQIVQLGREGRGAAWIAAVVAVATSLLSVAAAPPLSQRGAGLPTAKEVLDRYVAATGGREALLRHKSMTTHARLQVPTKGYDFEIVSYTKNGKQFQKVVMPGGRVEDSGYDGTVSWTVDSAGKVSLDEGDVIKTVARDADMYYHLHVLDYFRSMEVADVAEFRGHTCYHLKGINNWGQPNEQFYDKETGLLIGYAFDTKWRGGDGPATEYFEDYEPFGGVLMPTKQTHTEGGHVTIITTTSVTFDDVDDSVFVLPDAVKAMVNEKKAKSGQ